MAEIFGGEDKVPL